MGTLIALLRGLHFSVVCITVHFIIQRAEYGGRYPFVISEKLLKLPAVPEAEHGTDPGKRQIRGQQNGLDVPHFFIRDGLFMEIPKFFL